VAGVFCALTFVESGSRAHFLVAAALAPAAFLFDVLDGRIARWRHTHSAGEDTVQVSLFDLATGTYVGAPDGRPDLVSDAQRGTGRIVCNVQRFNPTTQQLKDSVAWKRVPAAQGDDSLGNGDPTFPVPIPSPVGPDAIPNCVPMNVFGIGNQALVMGSELTREDGRWRAEQAPTPSVPASFAASLSTRLQTLDPDARRSKWPSNSSTS